MTLCSRRPACWTSFTFQRTYGDFWESGVNPPTAKDIQFFSCLCQEQKWTCQPLTHPSRLSFEASWLLNRFKFHIFLSTHIDLRKVQGFPRSCMPSSDTGPSYHGACTYASVIRQLGSLDGEWASRHAETPCASKCKSPVSLHASTAIPSLLHSHWRPPLSQSLECIGSLNTLRCGVIQKAVSDPRHPDHAPKCKTCESAESPTGRRKSKTLPGATGSMQ